MEVRRVLYHLGLAVDGIHEKLCLANKEYVMLSLKSLMLPFGKPPDWEELTPAQRNLIMIEQVQRAAWYGRVKQDKTK